MMTVMFRDLLEEEDYKLVNMDPIPMSTLTDSEAHPR